MKTRASFDLLVARFTYLASIITTVMGSLLSYKLKGEIAIPWLFIIIAVYSLFRAHSVKKKIKQLEEHI